jgi:hypothetical protein
VRGVGWNNPALSVTQSVKLGFIYWIYLYLYLDIYLEIPFVGRARRQNGLFTSQGHEAADLVVLFTARVTGAVSSRHSECIESFNAAPRHVLTPSDSITHNESFP